MNRRSSLFGRWIRRRAVPAAAALALAILVSPALGQGHRPARQQDRPRRSDVARPGGHESIRIIGRSRREADRRFPRHDRRFFGRSHAFRSRFYGGHGWWAGAPRMVVGRTPFYFSSALGLWIGGLALNTELALAPPDGYAYYDPYCRRDFLTLDAYRAHVRGIHHPCAVSLIRVTGTWDD